MAYILNFKSLDIKSVPEVGGKNASLGEMINAGIRVPPGFAVTTEGYLYFISETGIKDEIFRILAEMEAGDISAQDTASRPTITMNRKCNWFRSLIATSTARHWIQHPH